MKISRALRVDQNSRIAWVGAGGKTTAMFRTASQIPGIVLVSATTHLSRSQSKLADCHFVVENLSDLNRAKEYFTDGINLITGYEEQSGRLKGLGEEMILELKKIADHLNIPLLIEADGSRMLPLKAPAEHEPVIPQWVNMVVVVAGLSSIGNKLVEENVFRSEIFSQLSGLPLGEEINIKSVLKVLVHARGGLKFIPPNAERIVLLNQADLSCASIDDFQAASKMLLQEYQSVIVSTFISAEDEVRVRYENIAGVILAAGKSERFGRPKQLLEWKGKPFIVHVVDTALQSGLKPVVVVLGAVIEPIQLSLSEYPVEFVMNTDWSSGQAGSIASGIQAVSNRCGAAIFFVSDMPQVSKDMIAQYLDYQKTNDFYILSPWVLGKQTNPSMFDRRCFNALERLKGSEGGRQLFGNFPVDWIELDDELMGIDIDTPEDLQKFLDLSRG